ncbi:MAG TPA: hypothetical protein DF613_10675 [Lachnospiraceae bacterium]|nr:hypothetical protein [Lachnospiraceae bacterium]
MRPGTTCKTVCQYSREPVPPEDMAKFREIAADYGKVKNYVYARYGGVGGLLKIYPGYTVQNEMTASGLRAELSLPSVYFYLAVFEALGDIKAQWTGTKAKILKTVGQNENFSPEEKHYLRFLLKASNAFEAAVNQRPIRLPGKLQARLEEVAARVDAEKLHRYLRRLVRKYHTKPQKTSAATGFSIAERAYRYGDHGIYISTKQSRKRIFVPLTDNNSYKNQLYIRLYPERSAIEIRVPVYVAVQSHEDYTGEIGLAMGMFTMLTTHEGHSYGGRLGEYQTAYAEWMRNQTMSYSRNRADNPGRKKYNAKKRRYVEQMHSYINHELNRFLRTEKPRIVYIPKLPRPKPNGVDKRINNSVTMWQRGYIRERLRQKCREQSVEYVEVWGKGISRECCRCGAPGKKKDGVFSCPGCGYEAEEKVNTAGNAWKRGREKEQES